MASVKSRDESERLDYIRNRGVLDGGFGTISRDVMRDSSLHATAKAIYAYFCSYAGGGVTAFPGYKTICSELGLSYPTYRKHRDSLIERGLISVEQNDRGPNGRWSSNVYTIEMIPVERRSIEAEASQDALDGLSDGKIVIGKTQLEPVAKDLPSGKRQQATPLEKKLPSVRSATAIAGETSREQQVTPVANLPLAVNLPSNNKYIYPFHPSISQEGRDGRTRKNQPDTSDGKSGLSPVVARLMELSLNRRASATQVQDAYDRIQSELSLPESLVLEAYELWIDSYREENPTTTRFAPRLDRWLTTGDGLRYWATTALKRSTGSPATSSPQNASHGPHLRVLRVIDHGRRKAIVTDPAQTDFTLRELVFDDTGSSDDELAGMYRIAVAERMGSKCL
ncbi:MAG: helix-turn-helix domain-containing protein [Collinsella sp.]|nr:helix-turn-helix domain-containing protein [Collinsella sp.]